MLSITFSDLLGSLDFWRGVGKAAIIVLLIYALLVVVLAELGVSNALLPKRSAPKRGAADSEERTDEAADEMPTGHVAPLRSGSSEAHREYLDRLRTALKYQGSTVALIVFSVLILGVLRVLDGPEVATILSGIAGFVLGTARADKSSDPPPQPGSNAGGVEGSP